MGSMIYYPGFELKNDRWLKYALLYFDELRPIIPYMPVSEEKYLSPSALKVMEETNLIRPYYPNYEDGTIASSIACEEFDKYFKNPELFNTLFNYSNPDDLKKIWCDPQNHLCNLYYGKFSDEFFHYCLENKIATEFEYGIRLHYDLAFVYMSYLADVISKKEQIEMFTDESKYNTLLKRNDLMLSKQQDLEIRIIKSQIETPFPRNSKRIALDEFIQLRANTNYNNCRIEYINQIEKYIDQRELNPNQNFKSLLNPTRDLLYILGTCLGVLGTSYLTVSSFLSINNTQSSIPLAFATTFASIPALKEITSTSQYFKDMKSKIQARRYLARVENLYDKRR